MLTSRAVQTLSDADASQAALLAWLALIVSRTAEGASLRLVNGSDNDDRRFTLSVWCGQNLLGAALGTEVFRGGEWMLTTYVIEAVDG